MTLPRCHRPNDTRMVTRRCHLRMFLLRPDPFVIQVVLYELAKAAERYGILIHAIVVMSNHLHIGLTDPRAAVSDFMGVAMKGISRTLNDYYGRDGSFWEREQFGDTKLLDEEAVERFVNYIWLNPVKAHLVETAKEWPGLMIGPERWGTTLEVKKPSMHYGRKSKDVVKMEITPPPCYRDLPLQEAIQEAQERIKLEEKRYTDQRKQEGIKVVGAEAVKKVDPFFTPDEKDESDRRCPMFAGSKELVDEAKEEYKDFVERYQAKRERWVKGLLRPSERFPCGTVWLRRFAGVKCESPPEKKPEEAPPATG